jgi:hypothetical protein
LFSRPEVAGYITSNFEPVWQMVRPVPLVRIDFGNGKVLTRTLNGNIATYVCTAEGQVLDILPGIYTPAAYLDQLQQFRLLANYVDQQGKDKRAARLRDYHKAQVQALAKNEWPAQFVDMAPVTKAFIENRLKAVLIAGRKRRPAPQQGVTALVRVKDKPALESAADVASWKELAQDTQLNETVRRKQIHEMLAAERLVQPKEVTKRLYKEVLHADLDDPYLGLGAVLFAGYPFKAEEGR